MSCDITAGRLEPCKDSVGGITAIYVGGAYTSGLLNAPADGGVTITNDQITGFAAALTFYEYVLKGQNSFDQVNENSRDNGTSFWTQTGTFVLKKQDKATTAQLKLQKKLREQIIKQKN